MPRIRALVVAALAPCALAGCGGAMVEPTAEVRQGQRQVLVSSADTTLDESGLSRSDRTNCLARGDEGKVGFACLIRFTMPETDAPVSRAWLELRVLNPSPQTFDVHPALANWSEEQASWQNRVVDKPWQVAGAKGESDRGPKLGELTAPKQGVVKLAFDDAGLELVRAWLRDPSTHRGILI
ncbi:MAG TPA: hypothetical protein VF103_08055, partial [Polyangiaceae bacterium]